MMKLIRINCIVIILLLIIIYSLCAAVNTTTTNKQQYYAYDEKDPFVAGLLSASMLGLGQFYTKEYTKGSLFVLTDLLQKGMIILFITNFSEKYTNDQNSDKIVEWREISNTDKGLVIGFLAFYFGSRIYCIIDAMNSAVEYNKNLRSDFSYNNFRIQNKQENYLFTWNRSF